MSKTDWSDDKLIFRLLNNKTNNSRWENIRILRNRPSKELFGKCVELINKTKNDLTINSKWLEDLKNCYEELSKV